MIATYRIMTGKDKIDPGLFLDLVAERAGQRTGGAAGVLYIRVKRSRLDIRKRMSEGEVRGVMTGKETGAYRPPNQKRCNGRWEDVAHSDMTLN